MFLKEGLNLFHTANSQVPKSYTFSRINVQCLHPPRIVTVQAEKTASPAGEAPRKKLRAFKASDGEEHLGSSLSRGLNRPFPSPPPSKGMPLRILPIGGLGEIGMNCMLVGVNDRYIVIDAGLLFPDFQDFGMQKILPDTSFLHCWRDKIEALVITHGHEDHIGALPWVVPALDPNTPIYASSFVMNLIQRRMTEYSLFNPKRFKIFEMNTPFKAGPFEVQPIRVTHSIPDCCGLILRSDFGTIVHTGDWKIEENPVDGQEFDRATFDLLKKEPVALMMSDSTNVLSTGRTMSETVVHDALMKQVLSHNGKGRVLVTQFASNLHRLEGVVKAAKASDRKICFVGLSLNHYLEAAAKDGRAPIDPKELIQPAELDQYDPSRVLLVTTGSQAEPRAALSLAARAQSPLLKIRPDDLVLYSAKVIPGNENDVAKMLNALALQGARIVQGRHENLHTSGHAYQEELKEVLQLVQPQHFLPVHGEYSFLCEHARLAREWVGVQNVSVIKNGQMLGVRELSSRNAISQGSAAGFEAYAEVVGEVDLINFYNDGGRGTGTAQEMAIEERGVLAYEGIVVAAVDVYRGAPGMRMPGDTGGLRCRVRVTTRGMWHAGGQLLKDLYNAAENAVAVLPITASLSTVERAVVEALRKASRRFNNRKPEVICVAHEHDPRNTAGGDDTIRPAGGSVGARAPAAPTTQRGPRSPWGGETYNSLQAGTARKSPREREAAAAAAAAAAAPSTQMPARGISAATASTPDRGASSTKADDGINYISSSEDEDEGEEDGVTVELPPGTPPMKVLPRGVMEKRRASNPRDSPKADGVSIDYD